MMMMINTSPTPTSSSSSIAAAGNNKAMVQQRHQDPLKCPRCDSANTKFCYYNNYSLSQPRHFCKACKRYWTRGGTLRNVPVGGGCRKNTKRHSKNKRLQLTSKSAAPKVDHPPQFTLPAATCSDLSSFFYRSAAATNSDVNTSVGSFAGLLRPVFCDIQPQLGAFGHGGLISSTGGFNNVRISDHMIHPSATTLLSDHYLPSFTSQAASLLVSSLKQPKMSDEYHQFMLPYDENLDQGNNNVNLGLTKEDQVKVEGNNDNNTESEWPVIPPFESAFSVNSSSVDVAAATDSSYLYWNSSALLGSGSGWTDAMNSSLAPLI